MTGHRSARLCALFLAFSLAVPAFAAPSKEMIELQTQVRELQDAIARLTQANDERLGVLKDLVQQNADSVNKMGLVVDALQKQLMGQQAAQGAKTDQLSGQVQGVNDSVDELKAKMNSLQKTLTDIQNQQQTINATLLNMVPPASNAAPADGTAAPPVDPAPSAMPPAVAPAPTNKRGKPQAGTPLSSAPADGGAAMPLVPAAADLYDSALRDYMAAKYPMAGGEFADVTKNYPEDPLSGNAFYYIGEIDYRQNKMAAAVKDYDHVIDQFPDSPKIAVSRLHKAKALLTLKQDAAAVHELQTLIQRFPNSPEAGSAKSILNGLGMPVAPRRP
jgi:TolA-binding protein